MKIQVPVSDAARVDERVDGTVHEVLPDIAYQRLGIVNVAYIGAAGAGDGDWFLVDAGVMGTTPLIHRAAEERYGSSKPAAIIMTHGHFDHVGALEDLASEWNVPIYAHPLEHPYLNGSRSYPPPDPTVGGGMMARLSPLYPRGPIDVARWLQPLPDDGSIPGLEGWQWIHTPGHCVGHVSFWRDADRTLLAGDALITTKQESAYAVAVQKPELHGPPMYFTEDWGAARQSVQTLARLEPEITITGHGRALQGADMRDALHRLADNFNDVAVPGHGRYVHTATGNGAERG